ncbi:MAG TPA: hypothetical protein ENN91_00335, partial [Firmicutes bacterium]|nr:hypothetical protein [Bacillota bacterium]
DEEIAGETPEKRPVLGPAAGATAEEIYSPGGILFDALSSAGVDHSDLNGESPAGTGAEGTEILETKKNLPGGREAGIYLHALLEETPVEEIRESTFEEWSGRETVRRRAAAALRRHGFDAAYLTESLQLVYRALRTPLRVQSCEGGARLEMPGGIAAGERQRAEMAFVYPIPENLHPGAGKEIPTPDEPGSVPYRAVRGYLQGLIDLAFEYDHKIYLLDWKSDSLPLFDSETLQNHVDANYSLQARVYSLAIVRLLEISSEEDYEDKFGGILYAFIRGLSADDRNGESRGIWFSRPSFSEIRQWEKDFIARSEWGGAVIETKLPAKE